MRRESIIFEKKFYPKINVLAFPACILLSAILRVLKKCGSFSKSRVDWSERQVHTKNTQKIIVFEVLSSEISTEALQIKIFQVADKKSIMVDIFADVRIFCVFSLFYIKQL